MVSSRRLVATLMLGLLCFPAVSATPRVPHLDALAEGLERQTGTRQLQVVAEPEVGFSPSTSRSEGAKELERAAPGISRHIRSLPYLVAGYPGGLA